MSSNAPQTECRPCTNLSMIGSMVNKKSPKRRKSSTDCKESQSLDVLPSGERSGGDVPQKRRLRCYQNPLEKWRENMEERQSLAQKIMRSTGKTWCDLLINRAGEERDKLMVKRMLQHTDDVHPITERVEPKRFRLQHRVPGGSCEEVLVETLPSYKENRCNKHGRALEISGLPSVCRSEIYGSCCYCNQSPWMKSQVLKQRMKQRRREIRHIVGHFPEIDGLQVVGAQKPITPVLVNPVGKDTCRGICGHPDCELRQALMAQQAQMKAESEPKPCRVVQKKRKARVRVVIADDSTNTATSESSQEGCCSSDSNYSSLSACCDESSEAATCSGTDVSSQNYSQCKNDGANDKSKTPPNRGNGGTGARGPSGSDGQKRACGGAAPNENSNSNGKEGNNNPDGGNSRRITGSSNQTEERRITISLIGRDTITVDVNGASTELSRIRSSATVMPGVQATPTNNPQTYMQPPNLMAASVTAANQHFQQTYPQQSYNGSFGGPNALVGVPSNVTNRSIAGSLIYNNSLQPHNSVANAAALYEQGVAHMNNIQYPTAFNGQPIPTRRSGRSFTAMPDPNMSTPNFGNPNFGNPNYGNPNFGNPNFGNPNLAPNVNVNANGQMVMGSNHINFSQNNPNVPANNGTYLSPSDLSAFVALRADAAKSSSLGNMASVPALQEPAAVMSQQDREKIIQAAGIRGSLFQNSMNENQDIVRNSLLSQRKSLVTSNDDGVEITVVGRERITINFTDNRTEPEPKPETVEPPSGKVDSSCQTEPLEQKKRPSKSKASARVSTEEHGRAGLKIDCRKKKSKRSGNESCLNSSLEDVRYLYDECCVPKVLPTSCPAASSCFPQPDFCLRPSCCPTPECNPCNPCNPCDPCNPCIPCNRRPY